MTTTRCRARTTAPLWFRSRRRLSRSHSARRHHFAVLCKATRTSASRSGVSPARIWPAVRASALQTTPVYRARYRLRDETLNPRPARGRCWCATFLIRRRPTPACPTTLRACCCLRNSASAQAKVAFEFNAVFIPSSMPPIPNSLAGPVALYIPVSRFSAIRTVHSARSRPSMNCTGSLGLPGASVFASAVNPHRPVSETVGFVAWPDNHTRANNKSICRKPLFCFLLA